MSYKERRRFARVRLNSGISSLDGHLIWPNQEITRVDDLSYKGLAVRRPGLFETESEQSVRLSLRLGAQPEFTVTARIAWNKPDAVGLEFLAVAPEGHVPLAEFLDGRLLGKSLRLVQPRLYNRELGFSHWLQGADSLSVLVWQDGLGLVQKVQVDWGGRTLELLRGQTLHLARSTERQAYLILSQMDISGLAMEDFVHTLEPGV